MVTTGAQAQSDKLDRVLVVEDDPDARRALERSLRRLGYEVTSAEDGEAGLKLAIQDRPQVILSDIRMPRMDGHTLLRRLAGHDLDAAVIVVSAHGDMSDVIDVLRNGAVDYLEKPYAPSELVAAVGRAVAIHGQRHLTRKLIASADAAAQPARAEPGEPGKRPAGAADPFFAAVLEQLRRGAIVLPPVPAILAELLSRLAARDSSMADIAAIVERDPRLAAQVLRITNTAQYARQGRVSDLRTAVERVGLRQMHSIVHTVLSHDLQQAKDPAIRELQTRIWRYSIARAVAMRGLAELVGGPLDSELAYLAGLQADSGAAFLLWVSSERPAGGFRPTDAHLRGLQEQHQEVGAALLAQWNMDPVVALVARTHHLEAPPAPQNGYWSLAVLAAAMADDLTVGDDPTRFVPPSATLIDRSRCELRIGTTGISRIAESVRREFDGVMEMLA
jgi:HD-like signal output (HDOD) protein/CheY-like chemotaxis protein